MDDSLYNRSSCHGSTEEKPRELLSYSRLNGSIPASQAFPLKAACVLTCRADVGNLIGRISQYGRWPECHVSVAQHVAARRLAFPDRIGV